MWGAWVSCIARLACGLRYVRGLYRLVSLLFLGCRTTCGWNEFNIRVQEPCAPEVSAEFEIEIRLLPVDKATIAGGPIHCGT